MRMRILAAAGVIICMSAWLPVFVWAQSQATSSAADIQKQIDAHNAQVDALNQEIAQYQTQLDATTKKKQTLQNTLAQINLSIKKTTASISVTQNKIGSTQLQIQQLAGGIADTQQAITVGEAGLAQSLRRVNEADDVPLVLQVISSDTAPAAWQDIDAIVSLDQAVGDNIATLSDHKQTLATKKSAVETQQSQLVTQKKTLLAQQGSLSATKGAQSDLLTQTKAQESTYQSIIAQKKAQEAGFEDALSNLKAQLNVAVNPSEITPPGPGILQWPIDGTIRITQYFGNTPFAQSNPTLYSGHGHDGLDIAAPIGTPVHAALSGTILATGNTDLSHSTRGQRCYSFGKWVMIKHNNGINTMYAHLSQISVSQGQSVSTGDVIGYSGETGYATGPHLHFGVYVSAVTQIIPLGQATRAVGTPCALAVMPVPPVSGYLNPLNYLPAM